MLQIHTIEYEQSELDSIQDNTFLEGAERRKYQITLDNEFKDVVLRDGSSINTECEEKRQTQQVIPSERVLEKVNSSGLNNNNSTHLKMLQSSHRMNGVSLSQQRPSLAMHSNIENNNLVMSQHQRNSKFQISQYQPKSDIVVEKLQSVGLNQLQQSEYQTAKSAFRKSKTSKLGKLQQIMTLKCMIQRVMRYVPSAQYARITQFHLDIIRDYSLARNEKNRVKDFFTNFPVLMPNHYLFDIWKISQILIVGYHIFRALLLICFDNQGFNIDEIRVTSLIFFFMDFICNLNAGFYDGLDIVTNRKRIIKHNFTEIISSLVSIFALVYYDNQIINLVFIVRLRSLFQNISIVEQNFSLNQKYPILVTISKLLMLIILIAHTFACGFVLITKFETDQSLYWLKKQNLVHEEWQKIYLNALYFAFITMITVGYGDITPTTDIEKMYVIFFTLITCIVYAYVVNTIGTLFSEFSQKSAEFKKQRYQVLSYMNDRRISKPVQISVIKYLEYTQQQEKVLKYSKVGEQFLQTIPKSLRQDKGQQYGIHSLFSEEVRRVTARCLENTSILYIHKDDFLQILKEFRNDYEVYCMVKDQIVTNYEISEESCTSCGYKDHQITRCELLTYRPRHSFIFNKCIYYMNQENRDNSFVRRGQRSNLALKHNLFIRQQLKLLRINILNKEFNNIIVKLSRKNNLISDVINDNNAGSDEIFYNLIPEFCYYHNEIVMGLDEDDLHKTSLYGSFYHQSTNHLAKSDSKDFDLILEDQIQNNEKIQQNPKYQNINKSELNRILTKQKSVQFSPINEEYNSDYNQNKNQSSFVESACSITLQGLTVLNNIIPMTTTTPLLVNNTMNTSNDNNQILTNINSNQSISNLKQVQQNPLTPPSSSAIFSQKLLNEPPQSLPTTYFNNYQSTATHTQSQNNQKGVQNNSNEQKANATQLNLITETKNNYATHNSMQTNVKIHQLHNIQRENSFNKNSAFSPNNFSYSNRTVQVPSSLGGGENTPQNQKYFNMAYANYNNLDKFQFTQQQQQQQQGEMSNLPDFQSNYSPPKAYTVQSCDQLPNIFENGSQSIQQQMLQQQQQQQMQQQYQQSILMEDSQLNKVAYSQKMGYERERKQKSNQRGIQRKDCCKMDKSQINSISNLGGENNYKNIGLEEEPYIRKSKRKITVFKDNLKLSIKDKRNDMMRKDSSQIISPQQMIAQNDEYNKNDMEEELIMKDIFVIMQFDMMQEYQFYFPQFNYSSIKFKNKFDHPAKIISMMQHTNILLKKNIQSLS